MKSLLLLALCPVLILSCEQHPLKNLREIYSMEQIKKFKQDRSVKMSMYNHVIAHDDVELLKMFFSNGTQDVRVKYEDLLLSQADRAGAEPVYFHPLHLAAQFGAENIAAFCVEHGASVNSVTISNKPDFNNNTPAHIAALYGQTGIIMILCSTGHQSTRGAFLDIRNGLNQTPEDIAREKQDPLALDLFKRLRAIREKYLQEQK